MLFPNKEISAELLELTIFFRGFSTCNKCHHCFEVFQLGLKEKFLQHQVFSVCSSKSIMDSVDPSALRIPGILMKSYNNVMQTPSGRADLKRISVHCGICRLVRYYSLTRGITRINGVVACEACRHCYQAYKRDPVPLHCTKGDGSCWLGLVFTKTKCRCCWLTQMLENTPISQHLYTKFITFLPHYIKSLLRGCPVQASTLTLEQRGCLALEVHTGTDWKDVTDLEAVDLQREPLQDKLIDDQETEMDDQMDGRNAGALPGEEERSSGAAVPSPAHQGVASPPVHSSAPLLPRSAATAMTTLAGTLAGPRLPMRGQKAVKRTASRGMRGGGMSAALSTRIQPLMLQPDSKSNSSSSDSLSMDTTSFKSGAINLHAKATKRSRGCRNSGAGGGSVRGRLKGGGVNKIDRLMAGIKEGLYGINIANDTSATDAKKKTHTSSSNSGVASAGQSSGVPSSSNNSSSSESSEETSAVPSPAAAPHIEDDVTVEEEFEEAISQLKLPDSMSGLLHAEQKKYLKDFNPRNSARVRRKKDRVEYFDTTKIQRVYETMVHDHKGRFVASDRSVHDVCDCLQGDCPGCHFPCPKCRSTKCGAECRSNRKWYYERVDVEGTDQFYVNRFSSAK